MKAANIIKVLVFTLSLASLVGCKTKKIEKNDKVDLSEMQIEISQNENNVNFICREGCAWKDLSFAIEENEAPQAVDEWGMTDLENVNSTKDENLADFLFTITRNGDQIILSGKQGLAWTELTYNCQSKPNCWQPINQYGMIK